MENTIKTYKCRICGEEHPIDKYDWVESCIGYYDLINIKYQEEEWNVKKRKH